MQRKNIIYIAILIGVYVFSIIFIFVPIINIMVVTQTDPILFILIVTLFIPLVTLGFLYVLLDTYKKMSKTSRDEQIDEVIFDKSKKPTEREMMEDWDFENKKRMILSAVHNISKRVESTIVYFEEIAGAIGIEEGEVEDITIILIAEGLIQGDVYFDEEDKGCVKLKTREFKVKYDNEK
ncbi:MAG: hypothetical protein EAX96_15820 [Candidatus Lokiarchaeota archaeon]|nr:hypothetical protein [Candidatus Lokiarchaeota archaeon]